MSYIHPPLVLGFGPSDVSRLLPEAAYVHDKYETRFASVYETSTQRILRGLIAEDVLAKHRGVKRASVKRPYAVPYDVEPDIQVRCVQRPDWHDGWSNVALTLYPRDQRKLAQRWVLAMLDYDRMNVRYLGWQTGPALLLPEPVKTSSKKGSAYTIIGALYPDDLRSMEELL